MKMTFTQFMIILSVVVTLVLLYGCKPHDPAPERIISVSECSDCVDKIWFVETDRKIYIVDDQELARCTKGEDWLCGS